METIEAIQKRYSCRKFKDDQIPDEALKTILQVGLLKPKNLIWRKHFD